LDAAVTGTPDVRPAIEAGAEAARDVATGASDAPVINGCTLKWSPSAMRDGDKAFEFLEMPDRNMIHPGTPHLTAVADHDAYRIDSHYDPPSPVDFDRAVFTGPVRDDRLRCEVRGMIGPSGQQDMLNGQTWRLTWSLYLPSSLKGTGRFTHIMQLKFIDTNGGVSGSPIITLSLRQPDGINLQLWLGGGGFPTVNLAGLHDKWLTTEVAMKIAPGSGGTVHWTMRDGARVLVDQEVTGANLWPPEAARARPKWGIYRGITTGVQTTYLLISDLRAYQCP
jgi:chitin-binding protein